MPLLSSLSQKTTLDGTEQVYLDDTGTDKRGLISAILAYIRQAGAAFVVSTLNKITITTPASGATLTIADGKTLAVQNSVTLAGTDGKTLTVSKDLEFTGTDGTSHTFPSTNATLARTDAAQTFTGDQLFSGKISAGNIRSIGQPTISPSTGIGYATGASIGAAVTQLTDKTTAVTLNKFCGKITMHNAALADATNVQFIVNCTGAETGDNVIVNHVSGGTGGAYQVQAHSIGGGSFSVSVRNVSGGSLSEAIVLQFSVFKSSVS